MSHGKCADCGNELKSNFHGDHKISYADGGQTTLENGQALCKECNLKKGRRSIIQLREWQKAFIDDITDDINSVEKNKKTYLLHAGVGSGKTMAATYFASDLIRKGWSVIICSPSENVKDLWAEEFLKFGINNINNKYLFRSDFRTDGYKGISLTYQVLSPNNKDFLIYNNICNENTLLILDEVHHTGMENSWGKSIEAIGNKCGFILMLTGTPTRSDNSKIPFAAYEPQTKANIHKLKVDKSYSYANSVNDKICCPISFRSFNILSKNVNGFLSSNSIHRNETLSEILDVKKSTFVYDMYKSADELLENLRGAKEDAAGLIVCNTIDDALLLGNVIPDSVVVVSDDPESQGKIKKFADSNKKWIIAVKMVSEGANIPRIRVIVFAINCTTMLFTQQVAGRGVRNRNDEAVNSIDHCFFFYPNYEPLVDNARQIEDEIKHIVDIQNAKFQDYQREYKKKDDLFSDYIIDLDEIRSNQNVYAGEIGIINGGENLTPVAHIFNSLSIQDKMLLERFIVDKKREGVKDTKNEPNAPMLKTDIIKEKRNKISEVSRRIAAVLSNGGVRSDQYGEKARYVNFEINKFGGCVKRDDVHDEQKLDKMLAFAIDWYNRLK